MTPKRGVPLPPIAIRDKRLRGGRLDLQPGTDSKRERNAREDAIRYLIKQGAEGGAVINLVRDRKLDLGSLREAVEAGTWRELVPAGTRAGGGLVPTIGELIAAAQQTADATLEPSTQENYAKAGRALLAHFDANQRADAITIADAQTFLHEPKQGRHGGRAQPWKPGTQATTRATVQRMWKLALRTHRDRARAAGVKPAWTENVWSEVELPRVRRTRHAFLSMEEWRALSRSLEGQFHHAAIAIGALAGLRAVEIVNLRTGIDVDLVNRVIHVQPRQGEYAWRPKTDKSVRTVEMTDELHGVLQAHYDAGFAGVRYFIRTPEHDRPIVYHTLRGWCKTAFETVGLRYGAAGDGLTLHSLRHTYASWMLLIGVPLTVVAELMGDDPKMVLSVYNHLLPSNRREAVQALDRALQKVQ